MHNPWHPPPAPPGFGEGIELPEKSSSLLSKLFFSWLGPLMSVGFSRPLEANDLWTLPKENLTDHLTETVEHNFYIRCPPEQRPLKFDPSRRGPIDEDMLSDTATVAEKGDTEKGFNDADASSPTPRLRREKMQNGKPVYDSSLLRALHRTFIVRWWIAGALKLISDTLKTCTPLVTKLLLAWLTKSYTYHRLSDEAKAATTPPHGIGYGIGIAFAIFGMQQVASLMSNHYMLTTMATGLWIRTSTIGLIFRKSLRLSGRARLEHNNGQITTMISTDASRLDRSSAMAHSLWVSPIQIAIGIILLILNLGYSALVGLGISFYITVLLLGFPIQIILVKIMFGQRKKGVKFTDARVRLSTEVLQGIRLIKYFAWESFYTAEISKLREKEIQTIRKSAMARSALIAIVTFIPVLASILSFITYALSGHDLNIAIIFSSLQLFNIIRAPLIFFPIVLAAVTDALVALRRITKFLIAEELANHYVVDPTNDYAVQVDADFTWENTKAAEAPTTKSSPRKERPTSLPTSINAVSFDDAGTAEEVPFALNRLKVDIKPGSFVCIVGRVGSGKSSLLQAMIGEMRRTQGNVTFNGTVAYVPQTPWIRNATLRENILFGLDNDEIRFREVVASCSLEHDLEILPHRESTEIGEKGINLSGGQKARVSLARATYSTADIVLLDDCLSAVDAHVGKKILENCILGALAGRTRILVTHALHVLDKADYIYVMANGVLTEQGTFANLMDDSVVFKRLMDDYGGLEKDAPLSELVPAAAAKAAESPDAKVTKPTALMQQEERVTGSVSWNIYGQYLRYAGGIIWAPAIIAILVLVQGAAIGNNLFLGFWTGQTIPGFAQGDYMMVYAGLGVAQAVFSFIFSFSLAIASLLSSFSLFQTALTGVLRSPAAFFDTTPMGRILSRLSKDQDTMDSELSMTFFQTLSSFAAVIGTVVLVFYTFPLLGVIFAPLSVFYYITSVFYRRSSVETKRLDSILRSTLYAAYSETLTGLSTVRAYAQQGRYIKSTEHGLDMENRAYYMTVGIQRWLALRLDFLGNILILGIGLFAAGYRNSVSPSKIGVVLSYSLSITQVFVDMIANFAAAEQAMNSVERVLVYADLPPEGATTTPNDPPSSWPEQGSISFVNCNLAYREGLPLVLQDVSFDVPGGMKVGIVGRTGAGKSSLLQALFRMVELRDGRIEIDGRTIRDMGLDALRGRLALVPQDSVLFMGTLRDNLDPQGTLTDSELISALQRAGLLPIEGPPDAATEAKFSLDSVVSDEGGNYSAGEKQLLALCRALVKNSKIIVLDEATSSVDFETDLRVQRTIQQEFSQSTILCIAHRLNTIAYYDKVLVMDSGSVAEYDTVWNLFNKEDSIFRSLCVEAGLSGQDIARIREENGASAGM